jgi:hypothetical protein
LDLVNWLIEKSVNRSGNLCASPYAYQEASWLVPAELESLIGQCRHGTVAECRILEALAPMETA